MVISGRADRSAVNSVRERLVAGALIPGLLKSGGRWVVPIVDLAAVLDALIKPSRRTPMLPCRSGQSLPIRKRPWRAPIGYRSGIVS